MVDYGKYSYLASIATVAICIVFAKNWAVGLAAGPAQPAGSSIFFCGQLDSITQDHTGWRWVLECQVPKLQKENTEALCERWC